MIDPALDDQPTLRAARLADTDAHVLASKVPAITALFWLIKVLTTGMGEAASDYLGHSAWSSPGWSASSASGSRSGCSCGPGSTWPASTGSPSSWSRSSAPWPPTSCTSCWACPTWSPPRSTRWPWPPIFLVWHRSEGTLSIHSITTRRRETFYWLAVLATFALGTAAGDLTAVSLRLGYFWSAVLFLGAIGVPALAWWRFGLNPILAFWSAYVLTRPLGASVADWFGKSGAHGGLGLGDGTVTVAATVAIAALVAYVAVSRRDVQPA